MNQIEATESPGNYGAIQNPSSFRNALAALGNGEPTLL